MHKLDQVPLSYNGFNNKIQFDGFAQSIMVVNFADLQRGSSNNQHRAVYQLNNDFALIKFRYCVHV